MTAKTTKNVHIVLLDYAKAFDHIDPNILVCKLETFGIPAPLLRRRKLFSLTGSRESRWATLLRMDRNLGHCATGHLVTECSSFYA